MGLIHSTQLGPPASGGGCVSPANNSALLVTKANAASFSPNIAVIDTAISADTTIRCTNQGELKTFRQIFLDDGATLPSSGLTAGTTPNIKVKRPNCECTDLTAFRIWHNSSTLLSSLNYFYRFTFSDGYSVNLGQKWKLLKVGTAGLEFKQVNSANLAANDYVVACQSYGKTTDVSTGCLEIVSKVSVNMVGGQYFAYQPETSYPQDSFGTSEMRAAIMLENGVYIFSIPNGGSY